MLQCVPEPSTSELFAAAIAGDEIAWEQLVDRLQGAIWGATSRLKLSQSQADDVFQTVWLQLLDRHETVKDPERLAGWLKTTAHREALKHLRPDQPAPLPAVDPDPGPGPEDVVLRRANSELLMQGFSKLSEQCKDILYLRATNVPYREIAERLGLAVGAIGPAQQRCLKTLRGFGEIKQAMEVS